jgi:outer membrane protein
MIRCHKIIILLIGFVLIRTPAFPQVEESYTFNLQQCIEYALDNNEDIQIADFEAQMAKARTGEFMSQGLPQVDAAFAFNKNFIVRRAFVPANTFNPSAPEGEFLEIPFGTPYDGDVGLNVKQMLLNGSYFVGLKASKTYQELSKKDFQRTRIETAAAVSKAYYGVMVSEVSLELAEANFNRLDTLLREITFMYENGFAEKIDLNRTTVEYNNAATRLENSSRMLEISKQILRFQMGMPVGTRLEIAEKFGDLRFNISEELEIPAIPQNRIEMSILTTQQALAELEMKNNQVQYLPTLDLFMGWGMNTGTANASDLLKWGTRTIWPDYQLVGLRMAVPIFDGLYKARIVQQNRLKIQQVMTQRQKTQNAIMLEVNEKRNNLINNIEQLKNQTENLVLAEEVFNHAKIKYQEGLGSNLEVIEADNAFKQAETYYFNAMYDALISHVDYQQALGILLK